MTNFPANWTGQDFDPNQHLMQFKGRDYLTVQNRMVWFLRDQRALIVAGLATMPYIVRTEIIEHDREVGWAHFKTYVRDVLGNEATMYGSESRADFADFAEKASTKSLGRALLALGYGTAFAPEMDEGERVVDSPIDRQQPVRKAPTPIRQPEPSGDARPATLQQLRAINKLCAFLGRPEPKGDLTEAAASALIAALGTERQQKTGRQA